MGEEPPPLLTVLQFEGVVIAALAVLFAAIWLRSREAGTRTLALGFAVMALWYLASDRTGSAAPTIDSVRQRAWGGVVLLGVMLITFGVVQYLGAPQGRRRWLLALFWLPPAALLVTIVFTPDVPRRVFHIVGLLPYVGAAMLAFRRAQQRPGDGHRLLGVALLLAASTPYLLLAAGMPAAQLKYFAGATVVLFGMALLTISLMRRQRELDAEVQHRAHAEEQLRDANARLEGRVHERTSHLHELIRGLETFNHSVSHDLRGPLSGMSALAHMASEALESGDLQAVQRALPVIAKQCDASVSLVATMLDLARLGDLRLQPESLSLPDLAQAAFDEVMLGAVVGASPEIHCAPMPAVTADPRLLRIVLVNLIGNAVKFTRDAAAPRIDVEASVQGTDLVVHVRDNGVGLATQGAERLFDPFVRAHGARFEGHGLGLSIVRRAVQSLGGRAWAESPPQGGAAFCFMLPGAVSAARPVSAVSADSAVSPHAPPPAGAALAS
jgi:signal transduction histidine kinase